MQLGHYLRGLHGAQESLAGAFRTVAEAHAAEADLFHICGRLAAQCDNHAEQLAPFAERYADPRPDASEPMQRGLFGGPRSGALGLLRDLQDLYVMAAEVDMGWTLLGQAAQGARDRELFEVVGACEGETAIALKWLRTRLKQAAPQALVVA